MKACQDKRKKVVIASMAIIAAVVMVTSLAWYGYHLANRGSQDAEVMTPYFLYLMNAGDENSLRFAVGNLHPGETKRVVICVTNKRPLDEADPNNVEIARESRFYYDMEFAHTDNLAVNYHIYELEKVANTDPHGSLPAGAVVLEGQEDVYFMPVGAALSDGQDVSGERHGDASVFGTEEVSDIWNAGTYLLYQKDNDGNPLQLEYKYQEETLTYAYEFDYYLVEIEWQSGITFSDYTKETDLVYVVVDAKQVEPTVVVSGP